MPRLAVPFIGQSGIGANKYRNDCAVACLAMILAWNGKFKPSTVDSLAAETSLRQHDVGVGAEELALVAASHGLPMNVRHGTDVTALRYELDHGRPVIAAVNEWKIAHRPLDPVDPQGAHDLVVVGYSGEIFYAHDPNGYVNMPVGAAELAAAMHDRADTALLVTADDNAPVTTPAARLGVTTDALRVRSAPSVAAKILAVLPKGERVLVVDGVPGWLRVASGRYAGGYVAAQWVNL